MQQPELSSGIEWMFHHPQVSDGALAEALLAAYGRQLAPLAVGFFGNAEQASSWLCELAAVGVMARNSYWGNPPLLVWLLSQAASPVLRSWSAAALPLCLGDTELEACVRCTWDWAVQQADLWTLAAAAGWLDLSQAAAGAKSNQEQISQKVSALTGEFDQHLKSCAVCTSAQLESGPASTELADLLRQAFSSVDTSWFETAALLLVLKKTLERRRRRRQWLPRLAEVGLVVVFALAAFLTGRLSTYWWADNRSDDLSQAAEASPQAAAPRSISYTLLPGETLEGLALRLGVPVERLRSLNQLGAKTQISPGQRLELPLEGFLAHPPPLPSITPAPAPPALPEDAPLEMILERAAQSRAFWQTLWADVQVIDYGPAGFSRPLQAVTRKQIWLRRPDYVKVIYGVWAAAGSEDYQAALTDPGLRLPAGKPEGALLSAAGFLHGWDFHNNASFISQASEWIPDLDLARLFQPVELLTGLERLGVSSASSGAVQERVAGRETRVVDLYNPAGAVIYRYWVDAEYGVVLRRREFSGAGAGAAVRDIVVTRLAYDVELPEGIFDPSKDTARYFGVDFSGAPPAAGAPAPPLAQVGASGHEPLPRQLPPPGFDPAKSRLAFQWLFVMAEAGRPTLGLDIFADDYYLGQVLFPDLEPLEAGDTPGSLPANRSGTGEGASSTLPSVLICKRSPDGRKIAFSLLPQAALAGGAGSIELYWLDLERVPAAYRALPEQQQTNREQRSAGTSAGGGLQALGDFAFSPLGNRLAFFACQTGELLCGIYLLDFSAGAPPAARRVLSLDFADYFLWNPDGSQLGFLGALGIPRSWSYMVVRLEDGEILDQAGFNWRRLIPARESPAASWAPGSPVQAGGLDGCVSPPAN